MAETDRKNHWTIQPNDLIERSLKGKPR